MLIANLNQTCLEKQNFIVFNELILNFEFQAIIVIMSINVCICTYLLRSDILTYLDRHTNYQLPTQVGSRIEHMVSQTRLKYIILDHRLDINS